MRGIVYGGFEVCKVNSLGAIPLPIFLIAPAKIGTQAKIVLGYFLCWTNLWYMDCVNNIPDRPESAISCRHVRGGFFVKGVRNG